MSTHISIWPNNYSNEKRCLYLIDNVDTWYTPAIDKFFTIFPVDLMLSLSFCHSIHISSSFSLSPELPCKREINSVGISHIVFLGLFALPSSCFSVIGRTLRSTLLYSNWLQLRLSGRQDFDDTNSDNGKSVMSGKATGILNEFQEIKRIW